jgi:hypothetical protein
VSSPDGPAATQTDCSDTNGSGIDQLVADCGAAERPPVHPAIPDEQGPDAEPAIPPPPIEYVTVIHLTRTWVQYGIFGFAVLCIVIGAVEALFGR